MPTQSELYQQVTDQIVAAVEAGTPPWVKPWRDDVSRSPFPCNVVSHRSYHGVNILLLMAAQARAGYPTHQWLTFKQAADRGGHVRKGERGQVVCFWKFFKNAKPKGAEDTGAEDASRAIPMLRTYYVFNVAQCDDLEIAAPAPQLPLESAPPPLADDIARTGATITYGGDRACYRLASDDIFCPHPDQFRTVDDYHGTILHELTHWTAHKSRCGRDLSGRFGSEAYAAEELIAEIGSAFLCAALGRPWENLQHPAYVANWLQVLREDNRAIFTAARHAQAAADYLLAAMGRPVDQMREAA